MELLWLSTQKAKKGVFQTQQIKCLDSELLKEKLHFPSKQNEMSSLGECIRQLRFKETKTKKNQLCER